MDTFSTLESCVGDWRGTNRLHYPDAENPQESASGLTIEPVNTNSTKMVELRYTWSYQEEMQQGELTIQKDAAGNITAILVDSWHTSGEPMTFTQEASNAGISLIGSYGARSGPDWGWRIVLEPGEAFLLRMYNIPPEQEAEIAVECVYRRDGV